MYQNVDIPKRLQFAIILLVALLLMSVQQNTLRQLVSTSVKQLEKVESQLSFQQGGDTASSVGIVHGDTQFVLTACLAFALLLLLFPLILNIRTKVLAPALISRNSCCIVPKDHRLYFSFGLLPLVPQVFTASGEARPVCSAI